MINRLILGGILLFLFIYPSRAQEPLLRILRDEMKKQMEELSQETESPYFISYRVIDKQINSVGASKGNLTKNVSFQRRFFVPQIRLGSMQTDNFSHSDMGSVASPAGYTCAMLPIDDQNSDMATRERIWMETNKRYNYAVQNFRQQKEKKETSNKSGIPSFTFCKIEKFYEPPVEINTKGAEYEQWIKRIQRLSKKFSSFDDIKIGDIALSYNMERRYVMTSEGTEIVQNMPYVRLTVYGAVKAEDDMIMPLMLSYFSTTLGGLPTESKLNKDIDSLIVKLHMLKKAPVVTAYTGPALLSGRASGVFFHEIFGHRIEAQRMKKSTDGQTFLGMVNQNVLPAELSVYDDPSLEAYNGEELNGYYRFDDQGVRGQQVRVVENGILKNFLQTRTPLDSISGSNGHARADGGADPVSRQSNLIIETNVERTDEEMKLLLKDEIKKQGKEFGYFFKEVTGGLTYTGTKSINSFNVTPLEVYRVYANSRPDELVRGVSLIGTPLAMFSNIVCAGGTSQVFTGMCGAESGFVPVTAISPTILVNKIEVQRKDNQQIKDPILSSPVKDENNIK